MRHKWKQHGCREPESQARDCLFFAVLGRGALDNPVGWFASISGMIAAILVAGDFGRRATGWGFVIFCASSVAWITASVFGGESSLLWQNVVLLCVNIASVYRWLIRKRPPSTGS